jgi:hypothetical protein
MRRGTVGHEFSLLELILLNQGERTTHIMMVLLSGLHEQLNGNLHPLTFLRPGCPV